MHLHGHLHECIRDYGPVYSFWCFAFERMNGILGSYHTNNCNVSTQLAQRCLDSKLYAVHNWPSEFVEEYSLLEKFNFSKGSLNVGYLLPTFVPLPPITEHVFSSSQIEKLNKQMKTELPLKELDVLLLHLQTKAIMFGDYILAGHDSRHSHSSFVFASYDSTLETGLAQVQFFLECTVVTRVEREYVKKWFAIVSLFDHHLCKVWYGYPTEVWSTVSFDNYCIIPLSNIKCRVVYTKALVNFGRVIGQDLVYIVSPLL